MIRYKVVKVEGANLVSAIAKSELKLNYKVGSFTTAPIGGIMVFRTFQAAKNFKSAQHNAIFTIHKCEVKIPVPLCGRKIKCSWNFDYALNVWETIKRRYQRIWPAGTEAYRVIKLLGEVTE